MGTISRVTTWSTGDTLTAADLNGEFDNILSTANGSLNADNLGVTAGIASALKAVVLDSNKDFADGTGSNQIRNLTISGSLKIGTTFLPDASGGADLGSSSLEWGDLYIADDKFINLGSDQNILIGYDETTTDSLKIAATEGAALAITLMADEGDDAGDEWKLNVADGGTITLGNDIASAGTYVTHLTLTPHATVSSSTLALAGALTVAGTAGITGVATVGGLTIGSAVINEAELETIDGITAGTVAASKAVVVDSNKDIGTFRNITLNGTLSDGNYTFDTSGNVTGLGTVGSGAITSTGVVTGTGFTIGSAAINEAELETIDGVTAGTVAASKAVVVDSNKDIGSFRNITLTGELDGGSLDISGDADIDGTTNLDAVDIDGAVQVDATITVGADDQGYDVKFFGDTASAYLLWDTSADKLLTAGGATIDIVKDKLLIGSTAVTTTAAELNVLDAVSAGTVTASLAVVVDSNKDIGSFRNITLTGELDAGSLDISGDADIDGTANLDAVDIDGAVQIDNTVTVGVNGTGYDVQFFGDTSGSSVLWDQSADDLILTNAGLAVGSDATGDVYYRDANGFLARLGIGSDGQVLTSTGTLPNWEAAGAGGSFSGPGSSTENAIVRFTNTSGNSGDNSGILIDDSNNVTGAANVTLSGELDAATGDFSGIIDVAGAATLASLVCTAGGTFGGGYGSTGATISTAGVGQFNGNLTTDGLLAAATMTLSSTSTISGDMTFVDNAKVTLGTGGDADIYYDATDLIINPKVAGSGKVGIGNLTPTAHTNNSLSSVVIGTSAARDGLSIITATDGKGQIAFGDGDSDASGGAAEWQGIVEYDHSSDALKFYTRNYHRMTILGSGDTTTSRVGINTTAPDGTMHLHKASCGTETANALGDILVLEDDGNNGMSILTPDNAYGQILWGSPSGDGATGDSNARIAAGYNSGNQRLDISVGQTNSAVTVHDTGNVAISGALSKGSGSFRIPHPLESRDGHDLVHSFLEGPQADLLYRGTATLSGGTATVNVDTAARMTDGTFVALCGNVQAFTTNETAFDNVRASVSGNVLTITSEDVSSTASISWLVVGERKDAHMVATDWTDSDGRVITEPETVAPLVIETESA
jgi:hypothetical protein